MYYWLKPESCASRFRVKPFSLPDRLEVPPDQLAHVHAPEVSG
jgi:hypothetical protein